MKITQAIVAYRNPFEMWLWESGAIFIFAPIFLALVCFAAYKAYIQR